MLRVERQASLLSSSSLTLPKPYNALLSFHTVPDAAEIIALSRFGYRFIADSGAFSVHNIGATIDIEEYAQWCRDIKGHVAWVASLDVIGNAAASYDNWLYLRGKGLDLVPTVHYPAPPQTLDRYADVDFVGLGGMVGIKDHQNVLRWLVSMFRYARDKYPSMKFHGWGCTGNRLVQQVPFYSIDSSGFSSGHRWGNFTLVDDVTGVRYSYTANGRDAYKYAKELQRLYNVSASEVAVSTPDNKHLVLYVAAKGSVNLQKFLRRRFGVIEAPTFGTDGKDGIHVHNVLTPDDYKVLKPTLKETS